MKPSNSKITGGFLRGREILSPGSKNTHPMGSRERLAILNSIGPDINGSKVLDLFAGTGALGIESLSRGAKSATFVEKNHKTATILRKNLSLLNLEKIALVYEKDANLITLSDDYDYIFLDPPYDRMNELDIQSIIKKYPTAKKIIISHPNNINFELDSYIKRTKTYAGASITIFTSVKN